MGRDQPLDLITIGRVSMDLFSQEIGAPFPKIRGFSTQVGGSPTNIAIGTSRLGLRSAALTAVGPDPVGEFILNTLQNENVTTRFIPAKPGTASPLAVLGIQPPDRFPLTFYRDNPADMHLDIEDVLAAEIPRCRSLLLSGTALSRGSCQHASLFALEQARKHGVMTFMDLDLRPDQWPHPRAFGTYIRAVLPLINVLIGTEEEFSAALSLAPEDLQEARLPEQGRTSLEDWIRVLPQEYGGPRISVLKRGPQGVRIWAESAPPFDVPGFPVEVVNTVGAGDAFASGFIYGWSQGWGWSQCARFGNACGALVVTRHGCAAAMPFRAEVQHFLAQQEP